MLSMPFGHAKMFRKWILLVDNMLEMTYGTVVKIVLPIPLHSIGSIRRRNDETEPETAWDRAQ